MRIVQISTYDIQGGAALAAYRLHQGLRRIGQDCQMLVRYKASRDDSVLSVVNPESAERTPEAIYLEMAIQSHYIDTHRTDLSNSSFTLPYPGYDLSRLSQVQAADVINLHWVAHYQSPITLNKLFTLGKPVVWTLHDQWAFTGGCHYAAGCERYRQDCAACPQLANDTYELPAAVLRDRIAYSTKAGPTIVAPSQWLAASAQSSKLFGNLQARVIPNALDTETFRPLPKSEAKAKHGLGPDTLTLLFGAQDVKEKRKGLQVLAAAIQLCLAKPHFQQLAAAGLVQVLCFGFPSDDLRAIGIPMKPLGYLDSDTDIRTAYAAADLFILPSLEDNLPNTMLEAMSCGTPVIGSSVGGIPDVVCDGETGYLVPPGDATSLAEKIMFAGSNLERLTALGQKCRRVIEQGYGIETQARRYLALYQELLDADATKRAVTGVSSFSMSAKQESTPSRPSADLEMTLGVHFESIYEPVLSKSLREFAPAVYAKWQMSELDRTARLDVIHEQGRHLGEVEAERNNFRYELADLRQQFEVVEKDYAARLAMIEEQGQRLDQVRTERNNLRYELADLRQQFELVEKDRAARLAVIEEQGRRLGEIEAERNSLQYELADLHQQFKVAIEQPRQQLSKLETEPGDLQQQSEDSKALRLSQARLIEAQEQQIHVIMAQLRTLQQLFTTIQAGRVYRILRRLGRWGWVEDMIAHSLDKV